jgi:DNA-directed RNA polymerase subunit RPC12/RpoP
MKEKQRWKEGDTVPCPECGGKAHYKPSRKRGTVGRFVCEDCGEELRFLSDVSEMETADMGAELNAKSCRRHATAQSSGRCGSIALMAARGWVPIL